MRPNPVDSSQIVYSTYRRGQTASIAATTMYTAPTSAINDEKGAFFRVAAYIVTTVAGSAGTCLLTISWTDDAGAAQSLSTATIALNTLSSYQTLALPALVTDSATIQLSTTVAGAAGSPQYALVLVLERLK